MSLLDSLPHKCRIQRRTRTNDALGGSRSPLTVEYTDVPCWEQGVSVTEMAQMQKMNMYVTTKIYFTTQYPLTDRHEIVVTERNGTAVAVASQQRLQGLTPATPDASAGLGVLFRVMGSYVPGQDT